VLAGPFNGLVWQQYAMGGGRGVDEIFTSGRADLHICARSLHLCVYMFTYMTGVSICVSVCSRVMYTDNTCVCVHVYVYAHRECMCVCACLHILHACT